MLEQIINKQTQKIKENKLTLAVILVGSSVDLYYTEEKPQRDIDFFVMEQKSNSFMREIKKEDGVSLDISYISEDMFISGINEKWPFFLNSFRKYKILYTKDQRINNLIEAAHKAYTEGPKKLDAKEQKYTVFKLSVQYEEMLGKKHDSYTQSLLMNDIIKAALTSYFRLNNKWVPKEKTLLKEVEKADNELYNNIINYFNEYTLDKKAAYIYNIIEHVLKPFGGVNTEWGKSPYPLE